MRALHEGIALKVGPEESLGELSRSAHECPIFARYGCPVFNRWLHLLRLRLLDTSSFVVRNSMQGLELPGSEL
jgi:hypothetical protein